jgi:hypothetical protein
MYDHLADLPLAVEYYALSTASRDVSSDFTRVSTEITLSGGGETGRGEDVGYEAADHHRFVDAYADGGLDLAGEYTLESFSAHLEDLDLFPEPPERAADRHYRRWGLESAALDLALRQAETDLGSVLDCEYDPVEFVVSTRLESADRLDEVRAVDPGAEFKLDPTADWDDDLRTVPPETMTDRVLAAHEEYPDKRILAHYVQPHIPFIGEIGREIPHEVVFAGEVIEQGTDEPNIWEAIEQGRLDRDRAWEAYVENLDIALPAVDRLLDGVDGLSVVTADHGNVFGEHGLYGHPLRRHVPELIAGPWLEHLSGSRREVTAGEVRSQSDHDAEATAGTAVEERLADLGYL